MNWSSYSGLLYCCKQEMKWLFRTRWKAQGIMNSYYKRNYYSAKNTVFWDVMTCGSYEGRSFWGTCCLHHQGWKNQQYLTLQCKFTNISLSLESLKSLKTTSLKHICNWRMPCSGMRSVLRLLVIANVVLSSPILFTLMMEVILSSETSVIIRATRRNIPEDGILHSRRRENFKSYIALTGWSL
jgi:hypothetical protein